MDWTVLVDYVPSYFLSSGNLGNLRLCVYSQTQWVLGIDFDEVRVLPS